MTYRSKVNLSIMDDSPERDNIRFIKEEIEKLFSKDGSAMMLAGIKWQSFDITVSYATTTGEIPVSLGGVPTDALTTWVKWKDTAGVFTWTYDSFNDKKATFSCTEPASIRGMIGKR